MKRLFVYPKEFYAKYSVSPYFLPYEYLYRIRNNVIPMEEGMYGVYDEGIKVEPPCWLKLSKKAVIIKIRPFITLQSKPIVKLEQQQMFRYKSSYLTNFFI